MSIAKLRKVKGFTLIELMIVVAIIGILAAVAIPRFADLVTKSREAAVKANLGAVRSAISIFYGDNDGTYPLEASLVTQLTTGGQYMPVAGLGNFDIPAHGANANGNSGTGHDNGGMIDDEAKVEALGGGDNGILGYDVATGDLQVNCTEEDAKGTVWNLH